MSAAGDEPPVSEDVLRLSEWELWACATEVIRQYGADAAIHAAMRADALFEAGNDEGASAWRMIVSRITILQRPASARLN